MVLERLTFMLPHDTSHEVKGVPKKKGVFLAPMSPWWPALDVALILLVRGKIQMLRLEYPKQYLRGRDEDGTETDSSGRFNAIRRLRSICHHSPAWNFAVKWASSVHGDGRTVLELTKSL